MTIFPVLGNLTQVFFFFGWLLNRSWKLANSQNEPLMASLKTSQPQHGERELDQEMILEGIGELCQTSLFAVKTITASITSKKITLPKAQRTRELSAFANVAAQTSKEQASQLPYSADLFCSF